MLPRWVRIRELAGRFYLVYNRCMARTNIEIDDKACAAVMRIYGLTTKREAVNFALRELSRTISTQQARDLRGTGWVGDLDELRGSRVDARSSE